MRANTDPLAAAKGRATIFLNGQQVGGWELNSEPNTGDGPLRVGRLWSDSFHKTTWDLRGKLRDLRLFEQADFPDMLRFIWCGMGTYLKHNPGNAVAQAG